MTKDVLVKVKGTQFLDDSDDSIEVITTGQYYLKNGKHYIFYKETADGTELVTDNTVKAAPEAVEVMKKGPVQARLLFEKGKKRLSNYVTPMGLLILGITTTELEIREAEDEVQVSLEYSLEMNGEYISSCRMDISACSRKEGVRVLS